MRKKAEGNNRVVIDQDGVTEQVNHYYPYGGIFGEGVASSVQPYKFGGKELDRMNGLDWSDFGARMLDSSSGLWGSIDPMADKYHSISPYAYCAGNPILYVDPSGMDWIVSTSNGFTHYIYDPNVKSQADLNRIYGKNINASYYGTEGSTTANGDNLTLNSDGSHNVNGTKKTSEYASDNVFIGNVTKIKRLGENLFGSNYLGPWNPQTTDKDSEDSYAMFPIDEPDQIAFIHDRDYDKLGVSGIIGVFSSKTTSADMKFIINNINYMNSNNNSKGGQGAAIMATSFFTITVLIKTYLNSPHTGIGLIYNIIDK